MRECAAQVPVADTWTVTFLRTRHAATLAAVLCTVGLSACAPASTAHWEGADPLSGDTVHADGYAVVAALPDLTARQVARAAGLGAPTEVSETEATGEGWRAGVEHSEFATRVQVARECGAPVRDEEAATSQARNVFRRLGGDADAQAWFTISGESGDARVYAEPTIDGVQTWSTGIFVARVDTDGVCAISGTLVNFEALGSGQTLASPEAAFAVVDGGTYSRVEQTYTLGAGGVLAPVWRFVGDAGSSVVVDLGDGLESAPDTETYLSRQ